MDTCDLVYCGYPLHEYATRLFGVPKVAAFLAQVRYCVHGEFCETCCFQYMGKTVAATHSGQSRSTSVSCRFVPNMRGPIHERIARLSPHALMYRLVFGHSPTACIKPVCDDSLCVQIAHMAHRYIRRGLEGILPYLEVCEHGLTCHACCWFWHGYTYHIYGPYKATYMYLTTQDSPRMTILDYVLTHLLHVQLPPQHMVLRTCANWECYNLNHCRVTTRSIFGTELGHAVWKRKEHNGDRHTPLDHQAAYA
jgi:hypothetical protein